MLPSPAELAYFLEAAQCLNFSRAALNLGVTQPSLSLAIKRLEITIGNPLFIRQKNGVVLTQAGKQLHLYARKLVDDWMLIKNNASASHGSVQGRFTIGCNSVVAMYVAPLFLPQLLKSHPKLEIHFQHQLSQYITREVIQLNIDIGIVINPQQHPDLVIQKLATDVTQFWIGKSTGVLSSSVLICNQDSIQAQQLLKQCEKKGMRFSRIVHTSSMELVANLTAHDCGTGILPERIARLLYQKKLNKRVDFPTYSDELCLIYRAENRSVKAVQTITKMIKTCF